MKFHHAAALALVGWYLLFPILDPKSWKPIQLPLSKWDHKGSYDVLANVCKGEKT
jgi:hypothetical protein